MYFDLITIDGASRNLPILLAACILCPSPFTALSGPHPPNDSIEVRPKLFACDAPALLCVQHAEQPFCARGGILQVEGLDRCVDECGGGGEGGGVGGRGIAVCMGY